MKITKKIVIGILLCVILTWSGLAVWTFATVIADWTHCPIQLVNVVALLLCFGGFASTCIGMNDETQPDR